MNRRDVDLLDPAFHVDPHPAYTWRRDNEPVYRDRHNRLWGIATHADVLDVERRSTVFSSAHGYRAAPIAGEDSIIALDNPRHRQQRSLVSRRFTPSAATRQRHHLERLVAELTARGGFMVP